MSDETRLAEARRLMAEHNYRHDDALVVAISRAQEAEVKFGVLYADYERLTTKVDQHHIPGAIWEDRAHTAEQSLGEADAEIERLKGEVAYWRRQDEENLAEIRRLKAIVARVEALAQEWGIPSVVDGFDSAEDFADALHEDGAWRFARDFRTALDPS